jgi:hypothetical protein
MGKKYTRKNTSSRKKKNHGGESSPKQKIYDFVIIGGGIGGLNVSYQILKRFPHSSLALFEKEKHLGGRVFTYSDPWMNVEAGAGRFNAIHSHLIQLIKELGLYSRVSKINSSAVYAKADGSGRFYNSVFDSDTLVQGYSPKSRNIPILENISGVDSPVVTGISEMVQTLSNIGLDIAMGSDVLPVVGLLSKIIFAGMLESKDRLIHMTLVEYASTILSKEEISFLKDSFGYYSEIVLMNAYDSIRLMRGLDPKNPFFGLSGGLSLIIDTLEKRILEFSGARIYKGKAVQQLKSDGEGFRVTYTGGSIFCIKCICALPKQVIEHWPIFKPIRPLLQKIKCAPLCRIYSHFNVSKDGKVWFKGLPKFTTNNNLRMVIPISEKTGVIMISYTDNIFATFWNNLHRRSGIMGVEDELIRLMKESTGIDIPRPNHTQIFHWNCGTGYWGVGADSAAISEYIINPFSNGLFICGEHYSATYQQWMEGALETGDRVVQKLV